MGSTTPAADVAAMLIMEMVLHGWDVAKATGQDYHCDGELAQAVLEHRRSPGRPVPPVPGLRRRRPGPR